ncbi:MAG TPA: Hsp20/alpha crystallin family protein [Xanthobacteraceae bacterium]|nr:Hsp20/alpha crystallin family protein [Xanthobacteraceae bacterium]
MNPKSLIPIGREPSLAREGRGPLSMLQWEIDRLFDDFARGFSALRSFGGGELVPTMDVTESDKEIEIIAELPGLEEKDIEINVSDSMLTIRGEKKAEKEEKKKDYRLVERSYGSFSRSVELPHGVNPDSIKAELAKGVLKVTIPKPAQTEMKKIAVKAAA